MNEKELLHERIAHLNQQIIEFQVQKLAAESELKLLDQNAAQSSDTNLAKPTNKFTPEEKIGIFQQLFYGREDV